MGRHLRQWRLITGVSQRLLAERAGISVPALRRVEAGDPGVRFGNVVAVLHALQLADRVVEATDPLSTDVGRLRAHLLGRERAPRS
ncbi:helix-turn-helix domain-containing protein [Microbacterium sp. NPDC055683]